MVKIQGGRDVFDICSHIIITRLKIVEIPIPKVIIKHVEKMAARDKFTPLKFKNRAGVIYYNDCIVGVEYEGEDNQEN